MPGGRPPKYETPEEMQAIIDDWWETEDVHTIEGLAYALDLTRQSLLNYAKKDEFVDTIKRAKQRVLISVTKRLLKGEQAAAGPIFYLKNNSDYRDVQSIDGGQTEEGESLPVQIIIKKVDAE